MPDQLFLTPFFLDQPLGALETISEPNWKVNKPSLAGNTQQLRMVRLHRALANMVADALAAGQRPVSIAGDCCATIPVLAGLQRAGLDPLLLWFDAHGDFNTWDTTPSGFLGGMPLAMLAGLGEQTLAEGVALSPLPPGRIILTDARDLDPGERELVKSSRIVHLGDVNQLADFPLPDLPFYVHFDVDVLDPQQAPAMSYPAPDGPSVAQMEDIFKQLAASGQVAAVSMSTWNPDLDEGGHTTALCMHLLQVLLKAP
jgi:arginase